MNNRDILKEIHKSKSTYCSFANPNAIDYDFIVNNVDDILVNLDAGKVARAERLTRIAQDIMAESEGKKKSEVPAVTPESIASSEVVFRVMTWDHIPEAPAAVAKVVKGKKNKTIVIDDDAEKLITEYDEDLPEVVAPSPKYVKVNFPPFQHFQLAYTEEGEGDVGIITCVGKSHWKGDIDTGEFSKDHGKVTNKLALMYMRLVERYATRSNWRGYTYSDEMRSQALLQLSQIGLQFDENKSQNPFSYYTAVVTNSFTRVLNIEKRNQNIRDDILELNDFAPSYTRQNNWGGEGHGSDD